jgi:nucleoid-associated protein YgaU
VPPTRTPTPRPAIILGYHTVRYGESLFCIGRAYAVSPWAIASQNGIGYPYWARIGQRLAIPYVPWRYIPAGPVCARQFGGGTPPPPPSCRVTYTVRPGDTLYAIAWRYQANVWAIVIANNIHNPNLIFPGQVLCIP